MSCRLSLDDRELRRDLDRIAGRLDTARRAALEALGQELAKELAQAAPRRRGSGPHAADTIAYELDRAELGIGPGPNRWYLRYHETGTRLMPARPFVTPTVEEKVPQLTRHATDAYRRAGGLP